MPCKNNYILSKIWTNFDKFHLLGDILILKSHWSDFDFSKTFFYFESFKSAGSMVSSVVLVCFLTMLILHKHS